MPDITTTSTHELALIEGDLSRLTSEQRLAYYQRVCESLGINPLTRPFEYLKLNGRLILYARKDATDQLRKLHGISIRIANQQQIGDLLTVTVEAVDRHGRADTDLGVVPISGLKGEALSNAFMKAITKAKRRVTLSLAGLGMLDETEVTSIPDAQPLAQPTLLPPPVARPAQPDEAALEFAAAVRVQMSQLPLMFTTSEIDAAVAKAQAIAPSARDGYMGKIKDLRETRLEAQTDPE